MEFAFYIIIILLAIAIIFIIVFRPKSNSGVSSLQIKVPKFQNCLQMGFGTLNIEKISSELFKILTTSEDFCNLIIWRGQEQGRYNAVEKCRIFAGLGSLKYFTRI